MIKAQTHSWTGEPIAIIEVDRHRDALPVIIGADCYFAMRGNPGQQNLSSYQQAVQGCIVALYFGQLSLRLREVSSNNEDAGRVIFSQFTGFAWH